MPSRRSRGVEDSLRDALTAASEIMEWTSNKTIFDYSTDKPLRYSIERQFEILGEALNAADRLDGTLRQTLPAIGELIGLRNVIAHAYFRIDHEVVWSAIQFDIPLIQAQILELIGADEDHPGKQLDGSVL